VDVLRVLVNAGADMNQTWGDIIPALHTAIWVGSRKIVEILINMGADVSMEDHGETPMDLAIRLGYEDIVKTLHDAGGQPSRISSVNILKFPPSWLHSSN
jgi:ankyrin repeat protein